MSAQDRTFFLKIAGFGSGGDLLYITSRTPPAAFAEPYTVALMNVPSQLAARIDPLAPFGSDSQVQVDLLLTSATAPLFYARPETLRSTDGSKGRIYRAIQPTDTNIVLTEECDTDWTDAGAEIWINGECMKCVSKSVIADYTPSTLSVLRVVVERAQYGTRAKFHPIFSTYEDYYELGQRAPMVGAEILSGPASWSGAECVVGYIEQDASEHVLFRGVIEKNPALQGSPTTMSISIVSISNLMRTRRYQPPLAWNVPHATEAGPITAAARWYNPWESYETPEDLKNKLFVCPDAVGEYAWTHARFVTADDEWMVLKLGTKTTARLHARAFNGEYGSGIDWVFFNIDAYDLPVYTDSNFEDWIGNFCGCGKGSKQFDMAELFAEERWVAQRYEESDAAKIVRACLTNSIRVEYAQALANGQDSNLNAFVGSSLPPGVCLGFGDEYMNPASPDLGNDRFNTPTTSYPNAFFPASYSGRKFSDVLSSIYRAVCSGVCVNRRGELGVVQWWFVHNSTLETFENSPSASWTLQDSPEVTGKWIAPTVIVQFTGREIDRAREIYVADSTPMGNAFEFPVVVDVEAFMAPSATGWSAAVNRYGRGAFIFERELMASDNLQPGKAIRINMADVPSPAMDGSASSLVGVILSASENVLTRVVDVKVLVSDWTRNPTNLVRSWTMSGDCVYYDAGDGLLVIEDNSYTSTEGQGPNTDQAAWDIGADVEAYIIDKVTGEFLDAVRVTGVNGNALVLAYAPSVTIDDTMSIVPADSVNQAAALIEIDDAGDYGFPPAFRSYTGTSEIDDQDGTFYQAGRYV